jgi:YHS domain-containing protein
MKTTIITAAIASLLFTSCKSEKSATTQTPAPAAEKCIVSGETLGEMGSPFEYVYQGRTLKFCCKNCVPKFEKEPDKYLAKLK